MTHPTRHVFKKSRCVNARPFEIRQKKSVNNEDVFFKQIGVREKCKTKMVPVYILL